MLTQKMEIPIGFFEVGAVIDVEFPFEDKNAEKLRPSVIVKTSEDTAVAVSLKITSSEKNDDADRYPYSVEITDLETAGLNKRSWVQADKELVISRECKLYLRGHLSDIDLKRVRIIHSLAASKNKIIRLDYKKEV